MTRKHGIILLFLMIGCSLHAGRAGTAAFPFLKINPGVRPAGMGEAFTAIADDINALAWNPAGLSELTMSQATAIHMEWIGDMDYEYIAMVMPFSTTGLPMKGAFGISYGLLHSPETPRTSIDPSGNPVEEPTTFTTADIVFEIGGGMEVNRMFDAGFKLKYLKQSIDIQERSAIAFDLGISSGAMEGVKTAFVLRNIGGKVSGYPLPTQFVVGIGLESRGLTSLDDDLLLDMDAVLPIKPTKVKPRYNFGAEYSRRWNTQKYSIRGGYRFGQELGTFAGLSLGGGWGMQMSGAVMILDYAFTPYSDLGDAHRMGISVIF